MKAVVLIGLCLFALLALASAAERLDYILEYRGHCRNRRSDGRGECELKASSEEFITKIKGDGKVHLEIIRLIGSVSVMRISDQLYSNATYSARGNATFGVHQTHENHKLHFQTLGTGYETDTKDRNLTGVAVVLHVVAGEGALKGAVGTITINGVIFNDGEAILSAVGVIWI